MSLTSVPPVMNKWLASYQPRLDPRLRLLCLPFAGGSSMIFRGWAKRLPEHVEVCPVELPGRWMRMRDPLQTDTRDLVPMLADGLAPMLDRPYAIFGHSLGALIAFELARYVREVSLRSPEKVYVSARRAPHLTPIALHGGFSALDDERLVAAMNARYPGGFAPQVLADPELLSVVIPILRADMTMFEGYRYSERPQLDVPIAVLGGRSDDATPETDLDAWNQHSTAGVRVTTFEGGHFFIQTHEVALLEWLANDLGQLEAVSSKESSCKTS